jgi:hypothetical protein
MFTFVTILCLLQAVATSNGTPISVPRGSVSNEHRPFRFGNATYLITITNSTNHTDTHTHRNTSLLGFITPTNLNATAIYPVGNHTHTPPSVTTPTGTAQPEAQSEQPEYVAKAGGLPYPALIGLLFGIIILMVVFTEIISRVCRSRLGRGMTGQA